MCSASEGGQGAPKGLLKGHGSGCQRLRLEALIELPPQRVQVAVGTSLPDLQPRQQVGMLARSTGAGITETAI